jgi:hypothetical protein
MREEAKKILLAVGLVLAAASPVLAVQPPAGPGIQLGDGLSMIQAYDGVRKAVTIGRQSVSLSPSAAVSLEQQRARQGIGSAEPFSAKFSVARDASGQPVIESIHVFPPKRK